MTAADPRKILITLMSTIAPVDWDQESHCVIEHCYQPATHESLHGMVDDVPVYELLCCAHATNPPAMYPPTQRTLRNDIARALLGGGPEGRSVDEMIGALNDAVVTLEAVTNYLLVFGPQQLIEELCR